MSEEVRDEDDTSSRRRQDRRGDWNIKFVIVGSIVAILALSAAYHRDLQEKEKTINMLQEQSKCDQLQEELKRLKSENEGLQGKVEEAENLLKQEVAKNNELQKEVQRLEISQQGQSEKNNQAQQMLNDERERSKELTEEKKKCENNLHESEGKIQKKDRDNEVLHQKLVDMETRLKEKEKKSTQCDTDVRTLSLKIKKLEDISRADKQELLTLAERVGELEEKGGNQFRIDATGAEGFLRMHSEQGVCQVTVLRKDDPVVAERAGEGAITTTSDTEHIVDLRRVNPKVFTVTCTDQVVSLNIGG